MPRKQFDPNSMGARAGQALFIVITACLIVIAIAGTYKLVESWF